jgi:uncharacterized protein DUF416
MYPGLELHRARIDRLPVGLKAALAAACAQRQAEIYRAYVKRTGAGNSEAFDHVLNAIWDDIRCPQASEQERKKWEATGYKLLRQKTKDDIYTAGAEFAILSLLYSNSALTTDKCQDTIDSANQTFNSIDNYLTCPLDKKPQIDISRADSTAQVFAHPLSRAEHHRQERDLVELEQAVCRPDTIPDVVDRLRERSAIEARDFLPIIDGPRV